MKKYLIALASVGLVALLPACTSHDSHAHWGYEGTTGPTHWGDLDPAWLICKSGKAQSPINIEKTTETTCCDLTFSYGKQSVNLIDNGHTVKQSFDRGNTITIKDKTYNLLQVHFHSLSEHTIKGGHYPMEAHFVHQADDSSYAVVGVMLKEGKENPTIKTLWNNIPKTKNEIVKSKKSFTIEALLPTDRSCYSYAGSFTTPPGTEGVSWFVMATPVEISQKQLNTFKKYYNNNYRPVQPLNGRTINYYSQKK